MFQPTPPSTIISSIVHVHLFHIKEPPGLNINEKRSTNSYILGFQIHCILLHMLKQEAPKYCHSRSSFLCVYLRYNKALKFHINNSTSFCLLNPLFKTNSRNESKKKVTTSVLPSRSGVRAFCTHFAWLLQMAQTTSDLHKNSTCGTAKSSA